MVFGWEMVDEIAAECRFHRKVTGDDRVKVTGVMSFFPFFLFC